MENSPVFHSVRCPNCRGNICVCIPQVRTKVARIGLSDAYPCILCGVSRKDCKCDASCRRIRNNDPIHRSLAFAESFIAETRYFGKDAHSDALSYIASARQDALALCALRQMDGFTFKRIDNDAKRLVQRADAKLYATRQKLLERDKGTQRQSTDKRASSLAVLERYRAMLSPVNAL